MDFKMFIGAIINLLFIWLLFRWISKIREQRWASERESIEYNKPSNKFKREVSRLGLTITKITSTSSYPYVVEPNLNNKRIKQEPKFIKRENQFIKFQISEEIQKGRSELFFFNCLLKRIEKSKLFHGEISICGYYPDIVYMDLEAKVFIDIEIDEPYSLKSKEPIHYIDLISDKDGRLDLVDKNRNRDQVLKENGWATIRFSEQQIIESQETCCDIVFYVIDYFSLRQNTKAAINFEKLKSNRWTKKEAENMALINSRDRLF